MGLLSKIFGRKESARKGPPVQEVEVHFSYGSTNYQHIYALEDLLRHAIIDAAVGKYEGHDVADDGSDGYYYMYGPDAEAIYRVISPVLADSPFMQRRHRDVVVRPAQVENSETRHSASGLKVRNYLHSVCLTFC